MFLTGVILAVTGVVSLSVVTVCWKVLKFGLLSAEKLAEKRNQLMNDKHIIQGEAERIINKQQACRNNGYKIAEVMALLLSGLGGVLIGIAAANVGGA